MSAESQVNALKVSNETSSADAAGEASIDVYIAWEAYPPVPFFQAKSQLSKFVNESWVARRKANERVF
jgi:hypothetical protein